MTRAVVVLSGGLDSTVLLAQLVAQGVASCALSVDYGQRHRVELDAAQRVASHYGVPHTVANLSTLRPLLGASSQTCDATPVPEGHYTHETMKLTVVPNRNMVLLSVSIAHAIATGRNAVAYGAHSGDRTIYPDCREDFAAAMAVAALLCDWQPITLLRPFVHLTKADIVALGYALGVPFELTWSCYQGGSVHCGRCGTCVERREAFTLSNLPDPTAYA